ncbi:hypothetical protein BDN72DRAFT_767720 [Pluteus cervinus]|uniref:Uncharacterized protein n=1 Tax=Pluteus cervinus TaxID=181527 RepID=A0ACD3AWH5_9AGAR|nr:hypothetical protein BDN72DRAFT_767720 [Pluteus cervinus]
MVRFAFCLGQSATNRPFASQSTHNRAAANTWLVVRASSPGPPLSEEFACYSLPYGALGFVSHLFTYYTIFLLSKGRRPLWPSRQIKASKFDIIIGLIGLCVTTAMGIITLVRCRHSWQLIMISIWKLAVSWANTLTGVTTGFIALREKKKQKEQDEENGYISLLGWAGLISLLAKHWSVARGHFLALTISWSAVMIILAFCFQCDAENTTPDAGPDPGSIKARQDEVYNQCSLGITKSIAFLPALYCDWALGIMTGNLVGVPTEDNSVFYWTYFVCKRLTMFSW